MINNLFFSFQPNHSDKWFSAIHLHAFFFRFFLDVYLDDGDGRFSRIIYICKSHGVISHSRVTFTLITMIISELTLKLLSTLFVAEFFFVPGWTNRGSKPGRGERFFPPF